MKYNTGKQPGPAVHEGTLKLTFRQHRVALQEALNPDDLKEIWTSLVGLAQKGNIEAAREVFDRLFGKGAKLPDAIPIAPRLGSTADLKATVENLARAQASGEITEADLAAALRVIDRASKALEVETIERAEEKLDEVLKRGGS